MLQLLLDGFEAEFLDPNAKRTVLNVLDGEQRNLRDSRFLRDRVLGTAEFDWDFDALEAGFYSLVSPFMQRPSWTSVLFLCALSELYGDAHRFHQAAILLEFPYYASLINDHFNFNPIFAGSAKPGIEEVEPLTQLRYAGQYLSKYPAYLLIRNEFGLSDACLLRLHQWFAHAYVTLGISRGVLLKWHARGFRGLDVETVLQNAVHALSNYLILPVVLAALFADLDAQRIPALKRALAHLTLAAKLRFEARLYRGGVPPVPQALAAGFVPLILPSHGLAAALAAQTPVRRTTGAPGIAETARSLVDVLTRKTPCGLLADTRKVEQRHVRAFRRHMQDADVLPAMTARFERCFREEDADHA